MATVITAINVNRAKIQEFRHQLTPVQTFSITYVCWHDLERIYDRLRVIWMLWNFLETLSRDEGCPSEYY